VNLTGEANARVFFSFAGLVFGAGFGDSQGVAAVQERTE